ncbi:hypothetical protein Hanom_Chr08g00715621 [Helianthus anomalus]
MRLLTYLCPHVNATITDDTSFANVVFWYRVQSVRAGGKLGNGSKLVGSGLHILKPMKVFAGTILTLLNKKRE